MKQNIAVNLIERTIFNVRWLLNIFYLGLIAVLCLYCVSYVGHVVELLHSAGATPENMMMVVLQMVDIVMVANLVKMVITGSYNSFVSKNHGYRNENISSGMLKVKMATSIIGVSSIHLLQTFVSCASVPWDSVYKQIAIHSSFLIGALVLAVIEYIHIKGEAIEHNSGEANEAH